VTLRIEEAQVHTAFIHSAFTRGMVRTDYAIQQKGRYVNRDSDIDIQDFWCGAEHPSQRLRHDPRRAKNLAGRRNSSDVSGTYRPGQQKDSSCWQLHAIHTLDKYRGYKAVQKAIGEVATWSVGDAMKQYMKEDSGGEYGDGKRRD
jgi:hypothetical protein